MEFELSYHDVVAIKSALVQERARLIRMNPYGAGLPQSNYSTDIQINLELFTEVARLLEEEGGVARWVSCVLHTGVGHE